MVAEFKISRFIYNWSGAWGTGTTYNRDAIVEYDGRTYLCLEPHTSTDFYTDLYFPVFPRWELLLDGRAWKNEWEPDTDYNLGNIVRYRGIVYICTTAHTSGSSQIDLVNWTTYSKSSYWSKDWQVDTIYHIGDIVKYGGIVYRCIINHTSDSTTSGGLEVDLIGSPKWEIVNDGIDYKGEWNSSGKKQ